VGKRHKKLVKCRRPAESAKQHKIRRAEISGLWEKKKTIARLKDAYVG